MKRNLMFAVALISAMAGPIKAADTGQRAIKDETTANRDDGRIIKSETTISSDRAAVPPAQTADGSGVKFEKDVFTVLEQVRNSTGEGNIGASSRVMAEKVRLDGQTAKAMAPMQNLNQCRRQMLTDKAIAVERYLQSKEEYDKAASGLPRDQVAELKERMIARRDKAEALGGMIFDVRKGYLTRLKAGVDFMCMPILRNAL